MEIKKGVYFEVTLDKVLLYSIYTNTAKEIDIRLWMNGNCLHLGWNDV